MAGVPRQRRNGPRLGQPTGHSGGREARTLRHPRHPREPRVSGTPPRRPLTQGGKQISPCQPRARIQATTSGQEIPEFIRNSPRDRGGRGEPAREEGPGGRPGRSRHKPTTGPGRNTIEITIAIESPAGRAEGRLEEHNKRTRGRSEQLRWAAEVQQEGDEKGQRKQTTRRPAACFVDLRQR